MENLSNMGHLTSDPLFCVKLDFSETHNDRNR